jgi:hypothetical protein
MLSASPATTDVSDTVPARERVSVLVASVAPLTGIRSDVVANQMPRVGEGVLRTGPR